MKILEIKDRIYNIESKGENKYFIFTDLHNFFTIFKERIKECGFDENNKNHFLVICGDAFNKGKEAKEMYYYLKKVEKKLIYIKGNHEEALIKALEEKHLNKFIIEHSILDTICQLSDMTKEEAMENFQKACEKVYEIGFFDFLNRKLIDIFELGDFIFVHGYLAKDGNYDKARWLCGYKYFLEETEKLNKICVFGHMRHEVFQTIDDNKPIFLENKNGDKAICLDAYTALCKKMNVLIINN